jgi:hypothetical protein
MEFPRNTQKHCQSVCYTKLHTIWLPSIQITISRLRHHSHDTATVFDTNPSAHPLTTSNSFSSLIQLSFGMLYHLILSLLWISLNHRSKPTTSKMLTLFFGLLINCKYIVCSRRCIVVTIDGASYDVDVVIKLPGQVVRKIPGALVIATCLF